MLASPSSCPGAAFAVRKCPFLHELAAREGQEYAMRVAVDPCKPARGPSSSSGSITEQQQEQQQEQLLSTFKLFHGAEGVVPLVGFESRAQVLAARAGGCPFHHRSSGEEQQASSQKKEAAGAVVPHVAFSPQLPARGAPAAAAAAPLASMGMSFGPGVSAQHKDRREGAEGGACETRERRRCARDTPLRRCADARGGASLLPPPTTL